MWHTWGVPGCVTKCDRGMGSKLAKNSVTYFMHGPLQDCLLRSAPSPASVKHNGLEGREEGDGVMNRYLAGNDRKPIPGRRASNRKGTALPISGSPRAGNNKFRLRGREETAAETDVH